MNDKIQIGEEVYDGKLVRYGTRYFHYQSEYEGRLHIDVSKESSDSWQNWYVFESLKPLPVNQDLTHPYPRLRAATFISYVGRDYGGPGQQFSHAAYISKMTPRRVLITQSGGLDI